MNTQIVPKMEYDLKGHGGSHKALLAKLLAKLSSTFIYQLILIKFLFNTNIMKT